MEKEPWWAAYQSAFAASPYGSDSIGLFALGLIYGIDDIHDLAPDIVTGGGDDKKCDLIYIDREEQRVVVAQCYVSSSASKSSAPANKAGDLNTAVAWLLSTDLSSLPERLKASAAELREALKAGEINDFQIWYVHNLPESSNVKGELETCAKATRAAVKSYQAQGVNIVVREIGYSRFKGLFEDSRAPILVTDTIEFTTNNLFEYKGQDWSALFSTIGGQSLRDIYNEHGTRLFSANIRDYLGSRSSDSNINNGIKNTVNQAPENFLVFNNGITAIVNDYTIANGRGSKKISVHGLSIVNGAQTTGALASVVGKIDQSLSIPIRFIKTENDEIIYDIIKYNNSQNKVSASDFRSTDSVQKRLRREFESFPDLEYEAGRRGGASDAIRRRPNLLPSYTVGQALAAFHGDPVLAYDKKSEIWVNDSLYARLFNEETTAGHILLSYSLLKNVLDRKARLMTLRKDQSDLKKSDRDLIEFFEKKSSVQLLVSAVAECMETILDRNIPNKFRLEFRRKLGPAEASKLWDAMLDVLLPLSNQLGDAFVNGRARSDLVRAGIDKFGAVVSAVSGANSHVFESFSTEIIVK